MRQVDCLLEDQDTDLFKYDEVNDKLYAIFSVPPR